jgi:hypothetical protein
MVIPEHPQKLFVGSIQDVRIIVISKYSGAVMGILVFFVAGKLTSYHDIHVESKRHPLTLSLFALVEVTHLVGVVQCVTVYVTGMDHRILKLVYNIIYLKGLNSPNLLIEL